MTGEITLRGKVLPIGGLKEKLWRLIAQASSRRSCREENRRDLADLPDLIKNEMKLHLVERWTKCWKSRWRASCRSWGRDTEGLAVSVLPTEIDIPQPRAHQ